MRVPESWLRALVNPPLQAEELADRLTMAGLEVEELGSLAPEFSGVVVARVLEVTQHPDADRLRVCKVDIGSGTPLQIVCGAPNVQAEMLAPCAVEGAVLPGGFRIKRAKMRGLESQGMLCSAKELGIAEDAEGLLSLPQNLLQSLGKDLRQALGLDEKVLTLKLTPNRADCLSILGVAREVSVLTGEKVSPPQWPAIKPSITDQLSVEIQASDLCARFASRIVKNVNSRAPTPDWMRQRLESAGQRSISVLVDISNYVMLELGQPNHIFDLDRISGGITVRWAKKGESITLLNDQTTELEPSFGVVADAKGVQSLAGIMGGKATSVSDETKNIYIEAAFWWPDAIRGRARRLNITTDAGHRFERGVDWTSIPGALDYITHLVLTICGGNAGPVTDQVLTPPHRQPVSMRLNRCKKILGIDLQAKECLDIFARLGFDPKERIEGGAVILGVTPPAHRFDIEIEEDLIEEIARVYGFNRIAAHPPKAPLVMTSLPENMRSAMQIRDRLVAADFLELITYSFISSEAAKEIAPGKEAIELLNPMSAHQSVMRPSLIPGLLAALTENLNRKQNRVRVFEIGRTFHLDSSVKEGDWSVRGVAQPEQVAVLAFGSALEDQWAAASRETDFFDLKADLQQVVLPLALETKVFAEGEKPVFLHPGRCAQVVVGGKPAGLMGELHPALSQKMGLSASPLVAELMLETLLKVGIPRPVEPSKFPPVSRDLAVVVAESVTAAEILGRLKAEKSQSKQGGWIQNIICFDEYRGKGLSDKEKSLGFRFILQSSESTLQDAEVDSLMNSLLAALEKDFSARLRA